MAFCAAYEKHGFDDYALISPEEVTALMTNPVLIAKTGTGESQPFWTDISNIGGTEAQYWDNVTKTILSADVDLAKFFIPVRRVVVV